MVSSTLLRRIPPQFLSASKLFSATNDLVDREKDSLVSSIYCTHQHFDLSLERLPAGCLQSFAILWDDNGIDSRVHESVEGAIMRGVMSPVHIIHHSEGTLTIVLNPGTRFTQATDFTETWVEIARNVACDDWVLRIIRSADLSNPLLEGRILRNFGPIIQSMEPLGLYLYAGRDYSDEGDWFLDQLAINKLDDKRH